MQQQIDRTKCTQAGLRKLGLIPPNRNLLGTGWIAAINKQSETPIIVEMENGVLFKLGGLTDHQKQQLSTMGQQLIDKRIAFNFERGFNDQDQPINPKFKTILENTGENQ